MARQVLPIAGAIVGGYFGGATGAQIGYAAGSIIGNAIDPLEVQGNTIGDNPLQTAAEGGARAIVFGKGCIRATCLLERGNRRIKKQRDQASKGGGPVTINQRVYWTFAIGLGEDLAGGKILRCWEGEKLVYDVTPTSTIAAESAQFATKFRFYDGSEDQLPDPALEAIHGVGQAPYYRGTSYVVFPDFDLTDYRESIPVYRWEVAKAIETDALTTAMAIGTNISVEYSTSSADGTAFSNSQTGAASWLKALDGGRFFGMAGVTSWYTDDDGVTKNACADPPTSTAGVQIGDFRNGVLLVPGGDVGGVFRSLDRAVSFEHVQAGEFGSSLVAITDTAAISVAPSTTFPTSSNCWKGSAEGIGFIEGAPHGITVAAHHTCASTSTIAIFSGTSLFSGGKPKISWTSTGDSFSSQVFDSSAGSHVTALHAIELQDGESIWVVGTNAGEIYYRSSVDMIWVLADVEFFATDVTYNGESWLFSGANSLGNPSIMVSQDLENFSFATHPYLTAINQIEAYQIQASNVTASKVPLSSIVSALHERAGQTSSSFDVDELTDEVVGAVFEQSTTFSGAINSLIGPHFADPSDYDKKIRYIKRGKPVVKTLTFDDLVDEPETTRRENQIEYPRKLHYFFQSSITAYAATKATSSRSSPDVNVRGEISVTSPITYDGPDEPAQVAAKLHKTAWTDAEGEIVWQVTDEHLDLVATDCVGLDLRGIVRRARIVNIEDDPGKRKLTMRVDRQSAVTSIVTGIPLTPPTPPQPSILAESITLAMDIPALRDNDDDLIYYDAISGLFDVWGGATLQRSLDDAASFNSIAATTLNAVVGVLQDPVPSANANYTDTTNSVVVRLYMDDELESISNEAFLSENGAFALSYDDSGTRRWEILQGRDVEQNSGGNWIITTLHRGQLSTEAAEHATGDYFVLLDASVLKLAAQSAWIGDEIVHRAVTNGLSPETATLDEMTYTGLSQTEWTVANVLLERVADDLAIEIVPRHRFGTDMNPVRSVNWDGYRVLVADGANSYSTDTTSADLTVDVTGWASPISVTVSQLNRFTGAGPEVTEEIA